MDDEHDQMMLAEALDELAVALEYAADAVTKVLDPGDDEPHTEPELLAVRVRTLDPARRLLAKIALDMIADLGEPVQINSPDVDDGAELGVTWGIEP